MTSTMDVIAGAAAWPSLAGMAPNFVVMLLVKVTLVLLVGVLAVASARQVGAAVRHAIWMTALAGTLLIPVLMAGIPGWQIEVLPPSQAVSLAQPQMPVTATAPAIGAARTDNAVTATPVAAVSDKSVRTPKPAASTWLGFVWLAGVIFGLVRLAVGYLGLQRVRRHADPSIAETWGPMLKEECERAGIARPVALFVSPAVSMPVTWGTNRPVILLPDMVHDWTERHQRVALRHELAHVARNDAATQLWTGVACAFYWFHPLVWFAARRLRGECERACDERVLALGTSPTEYAAQLISIARSARAFGARGAVSVAMARKSQLEQRLKAILLGHRLRVALDLRSQHRGSTRGAIATGMLASLVIIPLAVVQPTARASSPRPSPVLAPISSATAHVPGNILSPCDSAGGTFDDSTLHINAPAPDTVTLSWSDGRCGGTVRFEGPFTLTDDGQDVATLSPGGFFMIEEHDGRTVRRVEIRMDASGDLARTWIIDGTVYPYDGEARTWLAGALTSFVQREGLQRVSERRHDVAVGPDMNRERWVLRDQLARLRQGVADQNDSARILNRRNVLRRLSPRVPLEDSALQDQGARALLRQAEDSGQQQVRRGRLQHLAPRVVERDDSASLQPQLPELVRQDQNRRALARERLQQLSRQLSAQNDNARLQDAGDAEQQNDNAGLQDDGDNARLQDAGDLAQRRSRDDARIDGSIMDGRRQLVRAQLMQLRQRVDSATNRRDQLINERLMRLRQRVDSANQQQALPTPTDSTTRHQLLREQEVLRARQAQIEERLRQLDEQVAVPADRASP